MSAALPASARTRALLAAALAVAPPVALAAGASPVNVTAVATFLAFVAGTLAITWWAALRTRSRRDFYAAGGRLGGMRNGLALAGDFMSAASFLGMAGLTLIAGYDAIYFFIGLTLSWAVILLLVAERLRNLGTYTFADVVSLRLARRPMRCLAACGTLAVAVPYLLAQLVAAGTLVEGLFGIDYAEGVIVVGVLMTLYVSFGGMIATTWVQLIKAVLLLAGGTLLAFGVLASMDYSLERLAAAAIARHPEGRAIMMPGGLYRDPISVLSLSLAFIGGTAGLPHILMRFFTVPDARQARRSAAIALGLITCFNWLVFVIGLGAIVFLTDHPQHSLGGVRLAGGSNMAAIHLAQVVGGDVFLGFISAVAFATILAVVSGITLSAAATVSHDLYANVLRHGRSDERRELVISRAATAALGGVGVLLAIVFEGQNVAVLAVLPLVIAASANFPVLLLTMYWRGLTTRGALAGGYAGLVSSVVLVVLGPHVWVAALGFDTPVIPYAYPTLFSMAVAFTGCWVVSAADRTARARGEVAAFEAQLVRSHVGPDVRAVGT